MERWRAGVRTSRAGALPGGRRLSADLVIISSSERFTDNLPCRHRGPFVSSQTLSQPPLLSTRWSWQKVLGAVWRLSGGSDTGAVSSASTPNSVLGVLDISARPEQQLTRFVVER